MRRSRAVVTLSLAVGAVGSALALGAWALDPARAAVGPLPGEGLSLPAGTRFLFGLDVPRFVASPLYRRTSEKERPQALREIAEKTGLDPEKDVDLVVVAGDGRTGKGLVLVKGGFDRYRVGRALEKQGRRVTWKPHEGTTLYVYREGSREQGGLAFLSDDAFVLGDLASVQGLLTARAAGQAPLRENKELMALLDDVRPGAAFWAVGDESALSQVPLGGGTGGLPLAGLRSVVVSGELDPLIAVDVTGQAADETSARSISDVVKGFTALAQLQAGGRPEVAELAQSISVTTEGTRVQASARLRYELLDALKRPSVPEMATRPSGS